MELHLSGIGDNFRQWLENDYVTPDCPLTIEKMNEKRNHNSVMIDIASILNDVEFDDVKKYANAKKMWGKLKLVYG